MHNKIVSLGFIIGSVSFCLVGCGKGKRKTVKKPYVMYDTNLYGISSELPKSYPYNSMGKSITYVGTISEIIKSYKMPTENFQVNKEGYKNAKVYVDKSKTSIYLRFNEGLENDELIRFEKDKKNIE